MFALGALMIGAALSTPLHAAPLRRFHVSQQYAVKQAATLWFPVPAEDPWQRVTALAIAGAPFEIVHDTRYGNAAAHVTVPPGGATLTMQFDVERRERAADLSGVTGQGAPSGYAAWLAPDALVPLDARVRQLASEVTARARTPLEKARAIYAHVLGTMRYDKPAGAGQGWGRGDIVWACDRKYGNCTDFHALLIGLMRAVGIPARFEIGYSVPTGTAEDIPGYHCWADFYLDGVGWVPVDASEAWKHPERRDYFFGHHDENRFALSHGRDVSLPGQHGPSLNYFVYPYAEAADGRPIEVSRKTRYSP